MASSKFIQIIFTILLLLQPCNSKAQLYFKTKNLSTENGLSDNRVTCFHKDKKGFMWIGTRNGLNRYDGHSFKVFRPAAGNSISNEIINDIAEDSRGRIWVATMEGLNIYDPVSSNWTCMMPDPDSSVRAMPNFIVWDIMIDKNDLVWIASDVFEFCSYDARRDKFTYYDWPGFARSNPTIKQYKYKSIQKFLVKTDHEFWLATTTGLVLLNTDTKQFRFIGSGGYYAHVIEIAYDPKNKKVFISTENSKLFTYNETENKYSEVFADEEQYPSTSFFQPEQNEIWMSSEKGLLKISNDRKKIKTEQNIPQLTGTLFSGGTMSVYTDDKNIRWVATKNGISVFDLSASHSSFLPLLPVSDKESINKMSGVFYDDSSQCYFVCCLNPAAVFIINRVNGQIDKITTDANGNRLQLCINIEKDNHNNLWLLTDNNVYNYNRNNRKFVLFPMPNKGTGITFRDMMQDEEGNYWFAPYNGGLFYYNTVQKKFILPKDSSLKHIRNLTGISTVANNGEILIGSFGEAICSYNLFTGKKIYYYYKDGVAAYSALFLINDIAKDANGTTWVATSSGGVFRYNPGMPFEKAFTGFDMRTGFTNNNILSLCSDNDTTLFLLSGNGLSAINTKGQFLFDLKDELAFNFTSYTSDNIFPHDIFFSSTNKELLVGVGGGLLIYSQKKNSLASFPIVITNIKSSGKTLTNLQINGASALRIPYQSNSIKFEFAGLYYGNDAGLLFEYKLLGNDKDWVNANKNFEASYQNLPPGKYSFYVRAREKGGIVVSEMQGYSFRIIPTFRQTWWFYFLIAISLFAGVYVLFRYRLNQKLKLFEMHNRISQDLHDEIGASMSGINLFSQMAAEKLQQYKPEEANENIIKVKIYTQDVIEKLSDMVWIFNPQNDSIEKLLQRLRSFALSIADSKNIQIHFVTDKENEIMNLSIRQRKAIYLISKEAINNSFKYAVCSNIYYSLNNTGSKWQLRIQDDGNGFITAENKKGNGLKNMQARADEIGATFSIQSQTGSGTIITLEL
ncbi:MAG: two-component regulator propeller domain-containing protein [Ferruginibacter sp.]